MKNMLLSAAAVLALTFCFGAKAQAGPHHHNHHHHHGGGNVRVTPGGIHLRGPGYHIDIGNPHFRGPRYVPYTPYRYGRPYGYPQPYRYPYGYPYGNPYRR